MKYMFASDVHGSAYYCRKMLDVYKEEKAERLVLLGDLLYHGPRNDLPREYAPKQVISMLNDMKKEILGQVKSVFYLGEDHILNAGIEYQYNHLESPQDRKSVV